MMSSIGRFAVLRTIAKELALVVGCYLTFALAKNLTDPSPVLKAVSNGWSVLRLESALALNYELFIQQMIGRVSLGSLVALTYFYAIGMWVGLTAMAVILFIKNRKLYIYIRRIFVLSMLLAVIVFAVFPLAPPRFMPGLGVTDTVSLLGIDPAPTSDSAVSYNRFAAMPSLHYAWALLVMIGAFKFSGFWTKVAGFTFQLLMFVAIIATGNHYVLDAIAGAFLLLVVIFIARIWMRYDYLFSQWIQNYSSRIRQIQIKVPSVRWREQADNVVVPDLHQLLVSGFVTRGKYSARISPTRDAVSPHVVPLGQQSFRPELDNLSLVLS
jgi:hypothetical protein